MGKLLLCLVVCSSLVASSVASADVSRHDPRGPKCSDIRESATDLYDSLWDFGSAVEQVKRRSHVQWLAMSTMDSINYVIQEAKRIYAIYPRDDDRCGRHIQRFRNYTERQFCPHLLSLREAFRDDPSLRARRRYSTDGETWWTTGKATATRSASSAVKKIVTTTTSGRAIGQVIGSIARSPPCCPIGSTARSSSTATATTSRRPATRLRPDRCPSPALKDPGTAAPAPHS
jgi:hypothetical protein